jgi:hypothetical protein
MDDQDNLPVFVDEPLQPLAQILPSDVSCGSERMGGLRHDNRESLEPKLRMQTIQGPTFLSPSAKVARFVNVSGAARPQRP